MLFPRGELGWHDRIPSNSGPQGQTRSFYLTQRCFYAYHIHPCFAPVGYVLPADLNQSVEPNPQNECLKEGESILWGGKLFQQYAVDAWASTESSELHWIRTHQKDIRADLYQSVCVAVGDIEYQVT